MTKNASTKVEVQGLDENTTNYVNTLTTLSHLHTILHGNDQQPASSLLTLSNIYQTALYFMWSLPVVGGMYM